MTTGRAVRDRDFPLLATVLVAVACAGPVRAGEYVARIDRELSTLQVTACFDAPVPEAVYASFANAPRYLEKVRVDGSELPAGAGAGGRVPLGSGERSCAEFMVDARSAARQLRFPNVLEAGGDDALLLDPGDWLWLPDPATAPVQFVRFELPGGMEVSAPWRSVGARRFQLDGTMRDWSSLVAIGALRMEEVAIPGSRLRLAMLPGSPPADSRFVRDWIRRGAEAITTIYGTFPVSSPQVLVVPVGAAGEAVPWGEVQRGGGAAAHLFIDQTRPAAEFAGDWVLVHELAHLVHPNLGSGSAWLAEGLATYYQYVARARAGMIGEAEAWQKLHEGFERGRKQTQKNVTLIDATASMREQRVFMRVYWTGTAIALLADLALRDAGTSLDEALRRFRDCCLGAQRVWETHDFVDRLDHLTGTKALSDLVRRYGPSDRFPDLEAAYGRLGLRPANGQIELDPGDAPRELRRGIMGSGS